MTSVSSVSRGDGLVCCARLYPDKAYYCRRRATKIVTKGDGTFASKLDAWSNTLPVCDRHFREVLAGMERLST